MYKQQVIIIGAGAAGLMCGIEAAKRGRDVLILDHANKAGKKILMSGGGRCNFTNYYIEPERFISHNPHFCKSALSRYTAWDFIDLVNQYQIAYHEKTLGQLFCDEKSQQIVDLLLAECKKYQAKVQLNTAITHIEKTSDTAFTLETSAGTYQCESLVIATGGLSIPTLGATPFGYHIAKQFGLNVYPTRAGLVPFTLHEADKQHFCELSGIALPSIVNNSHIEFAENILFTHRGLSGPAILQISSYWQPGESVSINLLPQDDLLALLQKAQQQKSKLLLKNFLHEFFPKRVIQIFLDEHLAETSLLALTQKECVEVAETFQHWILKPNNTEGYRTAEVTLGGVDCDEVSSKTMESNKVPGLYFIGEVLDVTGWLGGYNFQWAWSSGWACGQVA